MAPIFISILFLCSFGALPVCFSKYIQQEPLPRTLLTACNNLVNACKTPGVECQKKIIQKTELGNIPQLHLDNVFSCDELLYKEESHMFIVFVLDEYTNNERDVETFEFVRGGCSFSAVANIDMYLREHGRDPEVENVCVHTATYDSILQTENTENVAIAAADLYQGAVGGAGTAAMQSVRLKVFRKDSLPLLRIYSWVFLQAVASFRKDEYTLKTLEEIAMEEYTNTRLEFPNLPRCPQLYKNFHIGTGIIVMEQLDAVVIADIVRYYSLRANYTACVDTTNSMAMLNCTAGVHTTNFMAMLISLLVKVASLLKEARYAHCDFTISNVMVRLDPKDELDVNLKKALAKPEEYVYLIDMLTATKIPLDSFDRSTFLCQQTTWKISEEAMLGTDVLVVSEDQSNLVKVVINLFHIKAYSIQRELVNLLFDDDDSCFAKVRQSIDDGTPTDLPRDERLEFSYKDLRVLSMNYFRKESAHFLSGKRIQACTPSTQLKFFKKMLQVLKPYHYATILEKN